MLGQLFDESHHFRGNRGAVRSDRGLEVGRSLQQGLQGRRIQQGTGVDALLCRGRRESEGTADQHRQGSGGRRHIDVTPILKLRVNAHSERCVFGGHGQDQPCAAL